ncbi:MAG: hypothetical protein P8Y18_09270 [Candidatus Bathyarchaeota archaeon]
MTKSDNVTVNIKYKDIDQTFSGDVDQVWRGINRFFSKIIPPFEILNKIVLTVELEDLIESCKNIIAITAEGPILLVEKNRLTDSEILSLNLLAIYIGAKLGNIKDFLTKEELQLKLGKNSKITSTRLGELIRQGKKIQEEILPEFLEEC